jgi:hypothetical protein
LPYTVAHVAAIIPLQKLMGKRASLSALVIGSMAPDFPLFVGGVPGQFSHSAAGLVGYCLPAGLLAYLLFHWILKGPTLALLPRALSDRLPAHAHRQPPASLGMVVLCLALGALSHLAWDAFTHADTVVSNHLPVMHLLVATVLGQPFPLYSVLQYLSSVVGLLVLAAWLLRSARAARPRRGGNAGSADPMRRLVIGILVAAAATGGLAGVPAPVLSIDALIYHVLVSGMQWSGAVWVAYCLAWHASRTLREGRLRAASA